MYKKPNVQIFFLLNTFFYNKIDVFYDKIFIFVNQLLMCNDLLLKLIILTHNNYEKALVNVRHFGSFVHR